MTRRGKLIRNSVGARDIREHVRSVERLIALAQGAGGLHLARAGRGWAW